ncbi:MAG TPA: sigma-70 family RNA polymerase sigma factor [Planctomycetota bacterium]
MTSSPPGGAPPDEFERTQADLAAFTAGDSRAFERLWRRFRPACEVLLLGRFRHGLEPALRALLEDELEDILQETALAVFRELPAFRYRGRGSLVAWIGTVAMHTAADRVDYWRAGKRNPATLRRAGAEGGNSTAGAIDPRDPGSGAVTRVNRSERRRLLAEVLATLPERYQTIVLWRFFAGAEWAEIAAEVGSPSADAVKMECLTKVLPAIAAAMPAQPNRA